MFPCQPIKIQFLSPIFGFNDASGESVVSKIYVNIIIKKTGCFKQPVFLMIVAYCLINLAGVGILLAELLRSAVFKYMSLLKLIVDFGTMLIGVEGVSLLRESESEGDPTGAQRRGGPRTARGKRTPEAEINRQV